MFSVTRTVAPPTMLIDRRTVLLPSSRERDSVFVPLPGKKKEERKKKILSCAQRSKRKRKKKKEKENFVVPVQSFQEDQVPNLDCISNFEHSWCS